MVLFKRVLFGGFRREDVLAYVEQLEEENERLQSSRNDEVNRLREELEIWKTRYEELENSTSLTISRMQEKLNGFQDDADHAAVRQKGEVEDEK